MHGVTVTLGDFGINLINYLYYGTHSNSMHIIQIVQATINNNDNNRCGLFHGLLDAQQK